MPQWQVEFKVVEGEGTLGPVKVDTDQEGYAESTLTPTGMPGTVKVEASPYLSAEKVTFTATTTD
ncbi:MAG: hypothetical protein U9P14_07500 [Gemmatimonadota bacterium]|nr:hypothetical protein [Gemmatimonadota bacterium]